MKTILVSILSFIIGMFAWVYIDFLNQNIYGDEWLKFRKGAIRFLFD